MPLKHKTLVLLSALFSCAALAAPAGAASLSPAESSLLQAMNRARAAHGLAPLRVDSKLVAVARAHTADMLRHDYFGHGSVAARMVSARVKGPTVGENLAWGVGPRAAAATIIAEWLSSPDHRRNLLRPGFRRVGIGSMVGRFAGYAGVRVVTADFAGT